jgi:diguanylate cyclase (GGDEF)-like protein/PAS domain S-box-containing protein
MSASIGVFKQNWAGRDFLTTEESFSKIFFENCLQAILLVDQSGVCFKGNVEAYKLLKIDPSEEINIKITDLLLTEDSQPVDWQLCMTNGPIPSQGKLHQTNGDLCAVKYQLSHLFDNYFLLHLEDISHEKQQADEIRSLKQKVTRLQRKTDRLEQIQAQLSKSERLFRGVFHQTFQLSSLIDTDGKILEDNQTALEFCQMDRSESIGRLFYDLPCWQINAETQTFLKQAIQDAAAGKTICYEADILAPDQSVITIDFSLKPLFDEQGNVELLIAEGRNISERKQTELALQASEQRFRSVLQNMPLIGLILDIEGNITFCNELFMDLTDWDQDEILYQNWFSIFIPVGQREQIRQLYLDAFATGKIVAHYESEILTYWGETRLINWRNTALYDQNHHINGVAIIGEDITDRRRGELNLQRQAVQEQLLAAITYQVRQSLDLETILRTAVGMIQQTLKVEEVKVFQFEGENCGRVIASSQESSGASASFSAQRYKPTGISRRRHRSKWHLQLIDAPIVQQLEDGSNRVWGLLIVHLNPRSDQYMVDMEWFVHQLADQLAVAIHQSELYYQTKLALYKHEQISAQFEHEALHDALTQLPNRSHIIRCLQQALVNARKHPEGGQFALLFLDLDGFKSINDTFGHAMGDRLLQIFAQRLTTCVRHNDMVARLSGDEFILLLQPAGYLQVALEVVSRVQDALRLPIVINGQELFVQCSIGIALGPADYAKAEEMLQDADTAMYTAKHQHLSYSLFSARSYPKSELE